MEEEDGDDDHNSPEQIRKDLSFSKKKKKIRKDYII